jgi:hypothetical protein
MVLAVGGPPILYFEKRSDNLAAVVSFGLRSVAKKTTFNPLFALPFILKSNSLFLNPAFTLNP